MAKFNDGLEDLHKGTLNSSEYGYITPEEIRTLPIDTLLKQAEYLDPDVRDIRIYEILEEKKRREMENAPEQSL